MVFYIYIYLCPINYKSGTEMTAEVSGKQTGFILELVLIAARNHDDLCPPLRLEMYI